MKPFVRRLRCPFFEIQVLASWATAILQLLIILLYNDETIYGLVCAQINWTKTFLYEIKSIKCILSQLIKERTDSDIQKQIVFLEMCFL